MTEIRVPQALGAVQGPLLLLGPRVLAVPGRASLGELAHSALGKFLISVGRGGQPAPAPPVAKFVGRLDIPLTFGLGLRLVVLTPRGHLLVEHRILVPVGVLLAGRQGGHNGNPVKALPSGLIVVLAVVGLVTALGIALLQAEHAAGVVTGMPVALLIHLLHKSAVDTACPLRVGLAGRLTSMKFSTRRHVGGQCRKSACVISNLLVRGGPSLGNASPLQEVIQLRGLRQGPGRQSCLQLGQHRLRRRLPDCAILHFKVNDGLRLRDARTVVGRLAFPQRQKLEIRSCKPPSHVQQIKSCWLFLGHLRKSCAQGGLQPLRAPLSCLEFANILENHQLSPQESVITSLRHCVRSSRRSRGRGRYSGDSLVLTESEGHGGGRQSRQEWGPHRGGQSVSLPLPGKKGSRRQTERSRHVGSRQT
mmetsp:Transcript_20510/g.46937  ORF Transcript_20510/g.46937 Transcript_20510/m.46937 type:complete len:420 (-) Transcript_20510:2-1261(-)